MPKFKYTAVTPEGVSVSGVQSAETAGAVGAWLVERHLQAVDIVLRTSILHFQITRKKVPAKELMHFSRQLAVFVRAGIPVIDGIGVILEEAENKLLRQSLSDMVDDLQRGDTFAGAAAAHPEAFAPLYVGILRSAELTGDLDGALEQLAEYTERDMEARRRITSAMVYPSIVIVMAIVTVLILSVFVMPRFAKFFKSLNAKLPLPTRMLLGVTSFMTAHWLAIIGALLLLTVGNIAMRRSKRGRARLDAIILHVPIVGDLVRSAILERFCRVLSSMVSAGVPLPDALTAAAGATNNAVYRRGLQDVREAMVRGEGLAAPLAATGLVPAAARQMVKVGEETGTLGAQLKSAADYFDRELDYKIQNFTSLFEPAIIVAVGIVVGFVAIALVSAMYGIYNQVKV